MECRVANVELDVGDVLVIYTDGVTEATGAGGEEFGEERLIELLRSSHDALASDIINRVVTRVREFSAVGEQHDDITVLVARPLA